MKAETIEEFLARGGKVEKIEAVKYEGRQTVRVNGMARIMNLDEGANYFSSFKSREHVKRKTAVININLIPIRLIRKLREVGVYLETDEV